MPINTGIGLVGVAIQSDETTPAERPSFVHGLTGGTPFHFERTVETIAVACGIRGNIDAHISEINMNPSVSMLGYQEVAPVYLYGALGSITTTPVEGRKGLYRHVVTIGESLPSLTIFGREGQTEAMGFGKTVSCKVNELELTFSDTQPLTMTPNLMGCNLIKLPEDPNTGFVPLCFDGYFTPVGGEFKLDTAGQRPMPAIITEGTWTITNDCEPVRDPTTARPARIAEKMAKAAVSLNVTPDDFDLFWRMVTGSSTATEPASRIVYGSYYAKFMHSENPDFTLTIEGFKVPFSAEVPEVDPEGGTGTFTFSSEDSYVQKVGDSPITITIVNDIADYFDPATYELPTSVPEAVSYGEVAEGVDAEDMGKFNISPRAKVISGTAKRITGAETLDDGYYLPVYLDEWEGATVTTTARGAAIPFVDNVAIVPLGTDGIDLASITVNDATGESVTYELDVECAEELPTVLVEAATGEHYGIDVSKLGTVSISNRSRTIAGTSEHIAVPDFNGKGKPGVGHFVAFDLEPREGTEVRLRKGGEPGAWKASDSEPWVVLLDAGEVPVDGIDVKAQDGTVETYAVSVDYVDEEVPVTLKVDRADDTPYAGHTVSDLGSWKVDAASRTVTGTSNLISDWEGYSKKERLPGYFCVLECDPWEGVAARTHRGSQWGNWANCQNNGVVVVYLGGEGCIDADRLEIRAASGETTTYGIEVDAASPVMARARQTVAKAKRVADKASE